MPNMLSMSVKLNEALGGRKTGCTTYIWKDSAKPTI